MLYQFYLGFTIQRTGKAKLPKPNVSPILSLLSDRIRLSKLTKRYQRYLANL